MDNVNHPAHYKTSKGIETIDVIEAFTEDLMGIEAVCTANAIKYLCRWKKKNGVEDLKKARWYLDHLIERVEPEETLTQKRMLPTFEELDKWSETVAAASHKRSIELAKQKELL